MRSIGKLIAAAAVPAMLLAGCGDRLEIEKQAHVVVLGVDLDESKLLRITFQIANPQVGSTERGKAEKEPPSDTITIKAPDIISAKELANATIPRKLSFSHLQTMIIGERLARSGEMHRVVASSAGDPEMRREMNVIISKEPAEQFIEANKPKLETRPHKYYEYMQKRWRDTAHVPYATVNRYFQRLSGEILLGIYASTEKSETEHASEDHYTPGQVPQDMGDPVQMIGSAVFKSGKMLGTLTGEETRIALMLRRMEVAHSIIKSFEDPVEDNFRVTVRLLRSKNTSINIHIGEEYPTVHVTVPLKMQVLAIPSLTDYVLNVDNQKRLKRSVEEELERKARKLLEKCQNTFHGEPFNWNLQARSKFWTLQAYDAYQWEKKFEHATVHVNFEVEIESFGKQFKPPQIQVQ